MKSLLLCILLCIAVLCSSAFFFRRSSSRSTADAAPREKIERADEEEQLIQWETELALAARQNWSRDEAWIRDNLRQSRSSFKFNEQKIANDAENIRKLEKQVQTLSDAAAAEEETPTQEDGQEHGTTDQRHRCIRISTKQQLEFAKAELERARMFLSRTHVRRIDTQAKIEKFTNDLKTVKAKLKRVDSMLPYKLILTMRVFAFIEKRTDVLVL